MKRLEFLKKFFTSAAVVAIAPVALAKTGLEKEYTFDELFTIWPKNERLIYPNVEHLEYKKIESLIAERIDREKFGTFLPVHQLSLPIKEKYTADELKPIQFCFDCIYNKRNRFVLNGDACFRMIKDSPDRMHLEVFIAQFIG